MNDCNIIIGPDDKGSGIVTWDKQGYLGECENQLTNMNVNNKVEGDPVTATNKNVRNLLDDMIRKKEIDE